MDLSYEALKKYEYSIHDPVMKILIPVNNSVDSRIGQFALSHGLSASGFDQLLELLNDPEIKTSELSFKSGADYERISTKHREKLQRIPSSHALGFPLVVLESVINVIRLEMEPFVSAVAHNTHRTSPHPESRFEFRDLIRSLRNMSLVHRSWVPLVHSLLHLRNCCTGKTISKTPSRIVASAIRELIVDYEWDEDSSLRSLNTLLGYLPNLRSLSIGMTDYEAGKYKESMRIVIGTIGTLTNLEVLLFPTWSPPMRHNESQAHDSAPYLFELCEAISNLKKLSVLWLSGLQCSKAAAETQLTEKLKDLTAPNVKTLVLDIPLNTLSSLPGHFLHWIIHAQERPSLENLIISSACIADNVDVTIACSNGPGFSNLKRLFLPSSSGSVYNAIYPLAQRIETLHLSIVQDGFPKRLPPRLKELIIQVRRSDKQADTGIVSLLERSDTGSLEKITLNGVQYMTPLYPLSASGFNHVSIFCGSKVTLNYGVMESNTWNAFFAIIWKILP